MSVRYMIIECDRCHYAATSLVTAGKFIWTDAGQEFWFSRKLAVCDDCKGVVAIEDFPVLGLAAKTEPRQDSFWRKLARRFVRDKAGEFAEKAGLTVAAKVLALKRRPVCLTCGGTNVTPIPEDRLGNPDDVAMRPLGIAHPGCGGNLTVRGSGNNRIAPREVTQIYDIHGRKIGERPGW